MYSQVQENILGKTRLVIQNEQLLDCFQFHVWQLRILSIHAIMPFMKIEEETAST